jgi:hypothetical protein
LIDLVLELVGTGKPRPLAGDHIIGCPAAGHLPAPAPNGDVALVPRAIHVDAIFPIALHNEGRIRRVDFEMILIVHVPYTKD